MIDLKNKVIDLKRFAFILLALSGFLSVGLVLPNETITAEQQGMIVGLIGILLLSAFFIHRSAMTTQRIINEER
ncbi:YrhC family protein [Evansella tamaricis]|uniref:YrhC family protein n=1 Tax=Evansella tamaricis TaxID=2069301 RepID=A0ABS6JI91_9BACI|nr:YrhC family protein [Evansella tamaricis]MBU9713353.1 YrhC family protein [Evansella tamaricis]